MDVIIREIPICEKFIIEGHLNGDVGRNNNNYE